MYISFRIEEPQYLCCIYTIFLLYKHNDKSIKIKNDQKHHLQTAQCCRSKISLIQDKFIKKKKLNIKLIAFDRSVHE